MSDKFGDPELESELAKLAKELNVVREDWNGFSVLHTAAARVAALELCALPTMPGGKAIGATDYDQKPGVSTTIGPGALDARTWFAALRAQT